MAEKTDKLHNLRHSLAHLLAAAVLEMYPDAKNTIGPAIDNGFYYDFDFAEGQSPSDKDLPKIEKKMREILKSWKVFESKEIIKKEALETYKDNPYKLELIQEIADKGEKITLYTSGKFTDLCRGGHLENPAKEIKPDSFKLDRVAGAYWRGDEKNKMLTRIYGLAFESKEELEAYVAQIEEAKKRDHKKLGRELDLFTFSELVGAGLPLWTPNGTLIRDLLDNFVWELRHAVGYKRVDIPHITKKELYETSGHWDKFKDDLFRITTREGHEFAMKPMNCPHHTQIFARKQWSYREMPERYASTTKVYRDEQTGELAGLSRVRSITQDDAHVFCRPSQVKEEISKIYDIVKTFYGSFGFILTPRLSLHDPKNMSAYLGTEKVWLKAEEELRSIVMKKGEVALEAVGEAAFYGPKIDFMAKDSLGREWQVATIQLDSNMPERFDLNCINEKGEKERIVMIHAAIMGSIERFLAILIEHLAGAFPTWLSPVQVSVIPIGEAHHKFAKEVSEKLKSVDIRAELNLDNESLGKKIRAFKLAKIPYAIVIGDKEVESKTLTVESRSGEKHNISPDDFLNKLEDEIKHRA
ncbi:MAG TPA: threonine--tRNA ligase [Candidatus Paceibacterota bacterium]